MTQFSDSSRTGGSDPGKTGGSDPGKTGGSDPGKTGGSDPGKTGGSDPGKTGGSDPGKTGGGGDPGGSNGPTAMPTWPIVIAERRLHFRIQRQEQSEWCWAAVAVSVERFFDPHSKLTQCEVANKVIPKLPKQVPPIVFPPSDCGCCCHCCCNPESCNHPAELKLALQLIYKWRTTLSQCVAQQTPAGGNPSPPPTIVSTGTLTFEEVCREIDRRRPIGVGITWDSGGGHFVVIRGYRLLSSGARQVYVADPLNPSSLVDFDEFTFSYFGDGEWTETDLVRNDWD